MALPLLYSLRIRNDLISIQIQFMAGNKFDAIVIGSGISGGWAAKELCEKGLKTLVLERGKDVVHIKDYPQQQKIRGTFHTASICLWILKRPIPSYRGVMPLARLPNIFL